MKSLKLLILKFAVLGFILLGLHFLYKAVFLESDIQRHSDIINLLRAVQDSSDILYLGESSDLTFRDDDVDKRAISSLLADYYPGMKVGTLSHGAIHSGIYKVLLKQIPENSGIKTIIVTLNLRSFDAGWIDSKLETSLQKSMVLLRDRPALFNRFLLSFKGYSHFTEKQREAKVIRQWESQNLKFPYAFPYKNTREWDKALGNGSWLNPDGSWDMPKIELSCHYVKTYAFQIDTLANPRIKDFDDIVELAKVRKWKLVYNLLAENLEKAGKMVGKDLVFLMKQNHDLLLHRYQKKGVMVVDNFDDVADSLFVDQNWTTEHYAEAGRKLIARNIADSLRRLYPSEYRAVNYQYSTRSTFRHDCEKADPWGQMQTLTDERAYSGKRSSLAGKGQDFSLTFEFGLQLIPDSLRNAVEVSCVVFQESLSKEAKLVIDVTGDSIAHYWQGVPLSQLLTSAGKWEPLQYSQVLPEEARKGRLIKVYIYNPGPVRVFSDDWRISFR